MVEKKVKIEVFKCAIQINNIASVSCLHLHGKSLSGAVLRLVVVTHTSHNQIYPLASLPLHICLYV